MRSKNLPTSLPPEEEILLLFHRLNRAVSQSGECLLPTQDLSFGKFHALYSISLGNDTVTKLVAELKIAASTTTVLVDKLVEAKLVKRTPDLADRRVTHLALTGKGQTMLETAIQAKTSHVKNFLVHLSVTDQVTLLRILRKAAAKL